MQDKPLVTQPGAKPSRKVMAGAVAGVITTAVTQWTSGFATQFPEYLAFLGGSAWTTFVPLAAAFVAAYLFRERANG